MPRKILSALYPYGLAIAASAAALLLTLLLSSVTGPDHYLLFVPAVAFSVWYGGIGPGILSIVLAILTVDYFFLPPIFSLGLRAQDIPRALLFTFVALMVVAFNRSRRRSEGLSALYDVSALANASLDLDTIVSRSRDRILASMHTDIGDIRLVNESTSESEIAAQSKAEAKDRANVTVPIKSGRGVIGTLSVARDAIKPFQKSEVTLLSAIADNLGMTIERALLFKEARGKAILQERERMARDLHDSVTQSLYSLMLLTEAARLANDAENKLVVGQHLTRVGEIGQQSLKEMRLLLYELRPLALQSEGLVNAIRQRLDTVERRAGVEANLWADDGLRLALPVEEALYRISEEALNNSLKHSFAKHVSVRLCANQECIVLEIADDGIGFDPDSVCDKGGAGLSNMKQRIQKLGGALEIISSAHQGTRVVATIPSPQKALEE